MNTFDINESGVRVWATSPEEGGPPSLRFEDDPPIDIPAQAQDVRVSPSGWACLVYGQNGQGYEVSRLTRVVTALGPVYCPEGIAYAPNGIPVWSDSVSTYRYGGIRHTMTGTSQGIYEVRSETDIVWLDAILGLPASMRTFAGIEFVTFRRLGPWVYGNSQVGSAAVNESTGRAYTLPEMNRTSRTLRGAMVNGRLVVGSSRPAVMLDETQFTPYVEAPVTYAPVVPIGRPLWMGWFEFSYAVDLPHNASIPVVQGVRWQNVIGPSWKYVSGASDSNVADIEAAIRSAAGAAPVIAYVPRGAQHALPTSADVQGVEAYLGASETDAQFIYRIDASLRKCPRAALIAQCYTSNTTLTSDLRRLPGLISQLARDHANVEAILVFSGSGRATGWQDHPEVHAAWQLVFDGITGTPEIETPPAEPVEPTPAPEPPPPTPEPPTRPPMMEQPPYTPPVATRLDKPIGGNAIADFFRALGRINFRKLFKGWFR